VNALQRSGFNAAAQTGLSHGISAFAAIFYPEVRLIICSSCKPHDMHCSSLVLLTQARETMKAFQLAASMLLLVVTAGATQVKSPEMNIVKVRELFSTISFASSVCIKSLVSCITSTAAIPRRSSAIIVLSTTVSPSTLHSYAQRSCRACVSSFIRV
jgi:hypothetical protein